MTRSELKKRLIDYGQLIGCTYRCEQRGQVSEADAYQDKAERALEKILNDLELTE